MKSAIMGVGRRDEREGDILFVAEIHVGELFLLLGENGV